MKAAPVVACRHVDLGGSSCSVEMSLSLALKIKRYPTHPNIPAQLLSPESGLESLLVCFH